MICGVVLDGHGFDGLVVDKVIQVQDRELERGECDRRAVAGLKGELQFSRESDRQVNLCIVAPAMAAVSKAGLVGHVRRECSNNKINIDAIDASHICVSNFFKPAVRPKATQVVVLRASALAGPGKVDVNCARCTKRWWRQSGRSWRRRRWRRWLRRRW